MTTAAMTDRTSVRAPRLFYLVMALVLSAIVALGFSHTIPFDLSTPGFPLFLAVHGVIFISWMALFVAQPALVGAGGVALHRKLGWVGAGLAVSMVILACGAILLGLWSGHLPSFYSPGLFLFRGLLCIGVFAGLVIAAITERRRAEWHKRLMLCASIVVIVPGLERALPVPDMGPNWFYFVDGAVLVLALIGPLVDFVTSRRVHPAYIWGVGTILMGQILVDVLTFSPAASMVVRVFGGH